MNNLYDNKDFFKLIINGIERFIDEPISWDTVVLQLTRDALTYGFNYEFVKDDVQLEFVEKQGLELISNYYNLVGSDGVIVLQYGYVDNATAQQVILFTGNLNLNTFKRAPRGCTCQVEKQAFENLIRTRIETKVSLNSTLTKDGNIISPCPYKLMRLHSKVIQKQTAFKTPEEEPLTNTYLFDGFIQDAPVLLYLQPDSISIISEEIKVVGSGMPGFIPQHPVSLSLYQLKPTEAGSTEVKFQMNSTVTVNGQSIDGGFAQISQITLKPYLISHSGGLYNTYYGNETTYYFTGAGFLKTFIYDSGVCEFAISVEANDELYIGAEMTAISQQGDVVHFRSADITNFRSDVLFVQGSSAPATNCKVYSIFDALNYILESITGVKDGIQSNFTTVGCGKYYAITNGFQIRNFEVSDRPVQCSLSELILGYANLFNMGVGYKTLPGGKEVVVYEPMEFFFSGNGIIQTFTTMFNYTEVHDSTLVFNEVEVGFETFSDEGLNTIDDFSTYHQYLLPIKTYKAKKALRSSLIASGYSIETQRREQFNTNPSSSLQDDDEIFIINYIEGDRVYPTVTYSVFYGEFDNVIEFTREVGLLTGDKFKIEGTSAGPNDGIIYTVHEKLQGYFERYDVTPVPFAGSGPVMLTIITEPPADLPFGVEYILASRDEKFTSISGLLSPSTTYNLEISPKRILLNWASFLNIGLTGKGPDETVENTFVKSNKDLTSELPASYTCGKPGIFREGDNIKLYEWGYAQQPFLPIKVTFDTPMDYPSLNELKQYLRGEGSNPDKNYGRIVFTDLTGMPWLGAVVNISYNPAKELATIQAYKITQL